MRIDAATELIRASVRPVVTFAFTIALIVACLADNIEAAKKLEPITASVLLWWFGGRQMEKVKR